MGAKPLIDVGAAVELGRAILGPDQSGELLDNFAHRLGQINKRWENRFVPERESLPEAYVQGRFEIALQGRLSSASEKRKWLIRIKAALPSPEQDMPVNHQFDMSDQGRYRRDDKLVVLVHPVQQMQAIETACPSLIRLDFIEDKNLRPWEGLLYRIEFGSVRYKTFPFLCEGKISFVGAHGAPDLGVDVIEGGSQVMNDVPDHEREIVWNWLLGNDRDYGFGPFRISIHDNFVKPIGGYAIGNRLELLDIAIGPLNL